MKFITENGGPIALVVILLGGIAGYIELRLPSDADIQAKVDAKFVEAGAVPPHRMDQAEKDIGELKDEDEKLDVKIGKIIDILLED